MLEKLEEKKVLRDPIHDYINIDYKVIWDCVDTKEFQRLRRIHQLGGTFQVYPSAEHSRFSHSLGVYEIVRRMVNEVSDLANMLSEKEKVTVMLAGLLHDVGHGPFSHAFEQVTHFNHEKYTAKIILENTEINRILSSISPSLPQEVVNVIEHKHENDILNQIVSAQLDADRMDYLLRDSYFSATSYGQFDLERILRTLRVKKDKEKQKLVIKSTGIHSVEDYIMARYQMYWQVYFHPVVRSYETVFINLFKRLKDLYKENKTYFDNLQILVPFLRDDINPSVSDHFKLDEYAMLYCCSLIQNKEDSIAKDLATRLINRDLFGYGPKTQQTLQTLEVILKESGFDPHYYLREEDGIHASPYVPYAGQKILILAQNGEIIPLEKASTIVKAITKGETKKEAMLFFPKEFEGR